MKKPARRTEAGQGPQSGWHGWCGPHYCPGPADCPRCDPTCEGRGKHYHGTPGRHFVPTEQEKTADE